MIKIFVFGSYVIQWMDLFKVVCLVMEKFVEIIGEIIYFFVLEDIDVVYVDKIESVYYICVYISVGMCVFVFIMVIGKVMLVYMLDDYFEWFWLYLWCYIEMMCIIMEELCVDIELVCVQGYLFVLYGEWCEGIVVCVCVIFGCFGELIGVIGMFGLDMWVKCKQVKEYFVYVMEVV